tara:strand:- start:1704 stop:2393 length:690 start_codon:yes stop_codon:yes gene_type:complete
MLKTTILYSVVMLLFSGCASIDNPDPYESLNRKVMRFNDSADRWVLKPAAKAYTFVTPVPVRNSIHNFFNNLGYPTVALNQLLQGKGELGLKDSARFLINSTLGIVGLFDVATKMGLEAHEEDFGQTFATWGAGSGAYLIIPFWGPVTTRSGIGDIGASFTYPVRYVDDVATRNTLMGAWAVDKRASLLAAESLISGDRYQFIRDAYLQRRKFLIEDGSIDVDPFIDNN